MIASLYQSVVVMSSAFDAEDVPDLRRRLEANVVPASAPGVTRATEQVVHDVRLVLSDLEVGDRHVYDRRLYALRVEIHRHEQIRIAQRVARSWRVLRFAADEAVRDARRHRLRDSAHAPLP